MTDSFTKAYDAKEVEDILYKMWENNKFFEADPASEKPPYCVILPPPNVTGALHMGHALVDTVQDALIRFHKMKGFETLWMPGFDHAGISTQTVVEKHLIKTLGKRRKDFSREEFLAHIWKWKEDHEKRIISQLKKVGCACDWSRQRFTMDSDSNLAVRTVFKKLYEKGLIYRGDYLVNWDPATQTALADDEVEYEERDTYLWHVSYPLVDMEGSITIATTRPETILADVAVAVNPKDERYKHLIGKKLKLPITGREIPIIADRYVDKEFGTGAVKITPCHDPNDYEIGINHKLEMINLLTPDGKINENGGAFKALTVEAARKAVADKLQELGALVKKIPHRHRVGISYRSKATIEPYLSKQWFVRMEPFKEKLMRVIKDKKIKMIPKNFENTYFHWISNLRDWCISRQLWWGHRIPIWYHKSDESKIICHDGEDLPEEVKNNPNDWQQDPDVLDTWFSSALWPFCTLGWPENTTELEKFYPTSVLVTGHDILFFWVARMIVMGEFVMDSVPFHETFLHGLIYGRSYWTVDDSGSAHYLSAKESREYDLGKKLPKDIQSKWEKMSKSKGNIIDPIEIIDSYGADAMRMALLSALTQARQIDLERRKFEEFKNFANKFWNSSRFVFMNLESEHGKLEASDFAKPLEETVFRVEDHWILSKYNQTIELIEKYLRKYEFDKATEAAYKFFWDEFCAYYVEVSKPYLFGKVFDETHRKVKQKLLAYLLLGSLRLMHPFVPFITEEVFQKMKGYFGTLPSGQDPLSKDFLTALQAKACMVSTYPKVSKDRVSKDQEAPFEYLQGLVYQIRNIKGEMQLPPSTSCDIYFVVTDEKEKTLIKDNLHILKALTKLGSCHLCEQKPELSMSSTGVYNQCLIMIPLPKEMIEKEKKRLNAQIEKIEKNLVSLEGKLSNKNFVERAPEELVVKTKALLEDEQRRLLELKEKQKAIEV